MPVFSAQQLQSLTGGTWLGDHVPACGVSGFTQDTRLLRPGMCFVALRSERRDGHAFLPAALEAGAVMALVERGNENCPLPQLLVPDALAAFQRIGRAHRQGFRGKVIGVTGSCGKTSTKEILRTLLGEGCHATEGNLNNFIGVPLTLLALETGVAQGADKDVAQADNQSAVQSDTGRTAQAPAMQSDYKTVEDSRYPQFAVIEAGISEPGEMAVLADMIRPDIALITMVGAAHLQDLGSVEGVAAEKAVLAHAVADSVGGAGLGVGLGVTVNAAGATRLPLLFAPLECFAYPAFAALPNEGVAVAQEGNDERAWSQHRQLLSGVTVAQEGGESEDCLKPDFPQRQAAVTNGAEAAALAALPAGIRLHRYKLQWFEQPQGGAEAFLSIRGECLCARFALGFVPSTGMASNLALALLVAHTLGVPVDLLAQRVRDWRPQGNRGSWKDFGRQRFFVDCYNANPASMQDSLSYFISALAEEGSAALSTPRLYVIGGMRELGMHSAHWHRQVGLCLGAVLDAQRGDAVVVIGEASDNAALEAGLRVNAPQAQVRSFARTQEAQAAVASFSGIIFLKGSRFYALEALLPDASQL